MRGCFAVLSQYQIERNRLEGLGNRVLAATFANLSIKTHYDTLCLILTAIVSQEKAFFWIIST